MTAQTHKIDQSELSTNTVVLALAKRYSSIENVFLKLYSFTRRKCVKIHILVLQSKGDVFHSSYLYSIM